MRVVVETARPVDLRSTLFLLRRGGPYDPCVRIDRAGVWRASRFASGPATARFRSLAPDRVEVTAWGPGATEAIERAPALVGATDDDGGLTTCDHPVVREVARRLPGLRLSATGNVLEALVPTILEQKVQGWSARGSFASMVRAARCPAPPVGPDGPRLLLPPTAEWLVEQPSWAWHRWGVEGKRAGTVRGVARHADRLARVSGGTVTATLPLLPGVGAWSTAEVAMVAFGDPDAVSVGDYWLAHVVCTNLAGEPRGTDERMLELLEPWAGQRGRVCRLLLAGGKGAPRYGPRLPLHDIRAI